MSKIELNNYCTRGWKKEFPYLRLVDKFALSNALYRLENGYKSFFEGRTSYPQFKKRKASTQSYTTNFTNGNIEVVTLSKKTAKGQIKLPKVGWVGAKIHRRPGTDWKIKTATVVMTQTGKFFVSVVFAYTLEPIAPVIPTIEKTLGLDYSSPLFYVDSNGHDAKVPHYYRKSESRLAREQRRLSKMVKGSKNYEKQRRAVAVLHEHVANQRKDFCHKRSREIANRYDAVCVEDIDLRTLAHSLNFGKSTNDNGFGMFRTFLQYKLEEQGKFFVVIDKWYPSTKTCHDCGSVNPDVKLGQMAWVCPNCRKLIDRDFNAALNIRDEGFRMLTSQMQGHVV